MDKSRTPERLMVDASNASGQGSTSQCRQDGKATVRAMLAAEYDWAIEQKDKGSAAAV